EARTLTGIERVAALGDFEAAFKAAAAGRAVFAPFRAESLGAATPQAAAMNAQATLNDPWDGRPSRNQQFIEKLRADVPGVNVRDLDPILDSLRLIKSPREIAPLRDATRRAGPGP